MYSIIERLKTEKREVVRIFYEQGRDYGLNWAQHVDYESLVRAVNLTLPNYQGAMLDFSDRNATEGTLPYILYEFFDENPGFEADIAGCLPEEAVRYVEGFLESVRNFWQEVEPNLS